MNLQKACKIKKSC